MNLMSTLFIFRNVDRLCQAWANCGRKRHVNTVSKHGNATRFLSLRLIIQSIHRTLLTIMPPRKRAGSKRGASAEAEQDSIVPTAVAAKLPDLPEIPAPPSPSNLASPIRFPILVVLSYGLSTLLNAAASSFTSGDLATVSAHRDSWWEIVGLLGWRAAELAMGWWGEYDSKLR